MKNINKKLEGRDLVREKIRIRDNHTCQHCGKKQNQYTRRLDVFNLTGSDRRYSVDEKKMLTLCRSCSLKEVYNRKRIFLNTHVKEIKEIKKPFRSYHDYFEEYQRKLGISNKKIYELGMAKRMILK